MLMPFLALAMTFSSFLLCAGIIRSGMLCMHITDRRAGLLECPRYNHDFDIYHLLTFSILSFICCHFTSSLVSSDKM